MAAFAALIAYFCIVFTPKFNVSICIECDDALSTLIGTSYQYNHLISQHREKRCSNLSRCQRQSWQCFRSEIVRLSRDLPTTVPKCRQDTGHLPLYHAFTGANRGQGCSYRIIPQTQGHVVRTHGRRMHVEVKIVLPRGS